MITIITAASQNHFKSLCQFIESAKNYNILNIYVYDLGLNTNSIEYLNKQYPFIIFKIFNYKNYPDYFNIEINKGEYAWKPAIIYEVSNEVKNGIILWCDAGNKFIINQIDFLIHIIKQQGIYTPTSSGNVKKWTYYKTLEYFNIFDDNPILNLPNRNGAIIGFNLDNKNVIDFINEYNKLACIKECIAPSGSSRENHRQDQSILTILYYKYTNLQQLYNNYISLIIHQDID